MICECYRADRNFLGEVGVCWGTAERDACSCGGDKRKCDFYPAVREKGKKPQTNADRIRAMSNEELADFLWSIGQNPGGWNYINGKPIFHSGKGNGWLGWLKREVNE